MISNYQKVSIDGMFFDADTHVPNRLYIHLHPKDVIEQDFLVSIYTDQGEVPFITEDGKEYVIFFLEIHYSKTADLLILNIEYNYRFKPYHKPETIGETKMAENEQHIFKPRFVDHSYERRTVYIQNKDCAICGSAVATENCIRFINLQEKEITMTNEEALKILTCFQRSSTVIDMQKEKAAETNYRTFVEIAKAMIHCHPEYFAFKNRYGDKFTLDCTVAGKFSERTTRLQIVELPYSISVEIFAKYWAQRHEAKDIVSRFFKWYGDCLDQIDKVKTNKEMKFKIVEGG